MATNKKVYGKKRPPHKKKVFDLFEAIGALVVCWSSLEYQINAAIWALSATSDRDGACVTAQLPTILSRMRAFIALVKESHGSPALIKDLNAFASHADDLGRERNRIIHDGWIVKRSTGTTARFAIAPDRKLVFEVVPHSALNIMEVTMKIAAAVEQFQKLRSRTIDDLKTHVTEQFGEKVGQALKDALDRSGQDNAAVKRVRRETPSLA